MEKLNLKVNGTCYEVEVGDLAACPVEVVVNGTSYYVEVEGSNLVTRPVVTPVQVAPVQAPRPAPVAAPVAAAPVPAAAGDGLNEMRAPMPGIIHNIAVKPGDKVTAGQQVFALEAMKMKSALRVNRDGVIASIEVTEGQKVTHGQVLLRFA